METSLLTTNDFYSIVTKGIPLIDVRAPIEFEKGAFITSKNLPIMNNEERHLVGTCYKEKGNEEAVRLGHQLVSGKIKEDRVNTWINAIHENPDTLIYCFRGGSRSRISQQWIKEATGKEIARLDGGYKAFRNYLMDALLPENQTSTPIILGGYTGSGKTLLLRQLDYFIDLEGIANHRGSTFGMHATPQPTQINFENNLAYALIQHQAKGYSHMVLEDEGNHVGTNYIPRPLVAYFNSGNLVVIDVPLDERVEITRKEYIEEAQQEYITLLGEEAGILAWYNYILKSMERVKKRLGGDCFKQVMDLFETAHQHQLATGDTQAHQEWIHLFLKDYYDPMYQYQLDTTEKKIIFRGNTQEVLAYLNDYNTLR